jgi:acetyl-CoA C-acetyltransferase
VSDPVIVSAVRTPIGKFQGGLASLSAPQLGARAVAEAVRRAQLKPADVQEVIMGNVLTAGVGQNPARQAALGAGLPDSVAAFTVNKVCGSSLKAVMLAAQAIKVGDAKIIVAGGQESMTNAPYLLPKARSGYRLGDGALVDSMIFDGLLDIYSNQHMGNTGEIVAKRYKVSREQADALSAASHAKASSATKAGRFKEEILPIEIPQKGANPLVISQDEGIREDSTAERLARLKPVFQEGGIVTAGNASQLSDGASAVVVMSAQEAEARGLQPLGVIRGYDTSGVKPEWVMEAPIPSVRNLFKKTGVGIDDVDLFEHNEAFATASCAVRSELAVPEANFNVHGGAVALGHPLGASGTRVLTTLLYALKSHKKSTGVATLCLGGGNAVSMLVERP